ncbi:MAG: heavy-metal-associated domain-containing protein [Campylobacterota bacterium]
MRNIVILCAVCIFAAAGQEVLIKVPKMHCPLCTISIKKAITEVAGVQSASVKLNTKTARVLYNDQTDSKTILEAIKQTGYEGEVVSKKMIMNKTD